MDDITKLMCNQLSEGYYRQKRNIFEAEAEAMPEGSPEASGETVEAQDDIETKRFPADDEITKGFINALITFVNSGLQKTPQFSFGELTYNSKLNRVSWSGSIDSKIKWNSIIMNNADAQESNVYFNISNESLTDSQTIALNKINIFLSNTWKDEIEKALRDKTLQLSK